jgi:hypothetical protein
LYKSYLSAFEFMDMTKIPGPKASRIVKEFKKLS